MIVLFYLAIVAFFFVCVALAFLILIQESKSLGFGASFGGDAGASLFGTSTPQVLKKITAMLAIIFFAGCLVLSLIGLKALVIKKFHRQPSLKRLA